MKHSFPVLIILLLSLLFVSCADEECSNRIYLDDNVSWAHGSEDDSLENALNYDYQGLKLGYLNLYDLFGWSEHYIWVKITFNLTDDLKDQPLGFVIPYVHFAEKTWLNGSFLGQAGQFGENANSPLYSSVCYFLPDDFLNKDSENVIYLKILSKGLGSLSDNIFIDYYSHTQEFVTWMDFLHSRIYLLFEGVLLCAFVFFLILYFANRKDMGVFNFSLICGFTSFLIVYFYGNELPSYVSGKLSHIVFSKIFLCICLYASVFAIVAFMLSFIEIKQPKWFLIFKHSVFYMTIVITLAAPDYEALMALCRPMILVYFAHFLLGELFVFLALFSKETRKKALIIIIGFLPMAITIITDLIVRFLHKNIDYPYFGIFGWQLTIAFFIIYLSLQYNKTYLQNERLNRDLRLEVKKQTASFRDANNRLVNELERADTDLTMASIVQQKFFPKPEAVFQGWDLALGYSPLSKVSGDLYDFYTSGERLSGLSVFDASGHGVAAALVTMLSKNIIQQAFYNSLVNLSPLSRAMEEVNDTFIDEKGEVENYLTGLMIRLNDINEDQCNVEMSVAGHPYPIFYSAETGDIVSLKDLVQGLHYGAVGMAEMMVDYADLSFVMKKDDILVCFTDGITEVENEDKEEFGRFRLEEIVKEVCQSGSEDIVKLIKEKVREFRGECPIKDDITLVVLKKT